MYEIAIARPGGMMGELWEVTILDAKGFSSAWISDKLNIVMQEMATKGWDFKGQIEGNRDKALIWQRPLAQSQYTDLVEAHAESNVKGYLSEGWVLLHVYTKRTPTDTPGIYSEYPCFVLGKLPK